MEMLAEEDVLEPHPDIHALFFYYDSLYFGDSLGSCSLCWSSPRMTRCAGVCHYRPGGGCEIRLSEPLLKFRPTADLKNTLLHEMIHAFLWINYKNRDHSDHGPSFQRIMDKINSGAWKDHQRPEGGYNVSVYHVFAAEVDKYQTHRWMCKSCGDLIKRAMNRAPSASDCLEKVKHGRPCGNPACHWHSHLISCSGEYVKATEPPGFKRRGAPNGEVGCRERKTTRTITSFFPALEKGTIPRRKRSVGLRRRRGGHRDRDPTEYTVSSGWLGWSAVEYDDMEPVEPLINKRTKRRAKQRMLLMAAQARAAKIVEISDI